MQKVRFDPILTFVWLILLFFGLSMVFSASSVLSLKMTNNESMYYFLKEQTVNIVIGIIAAFIIAKISHKKWKPYLLYLNIATIILLCLVGFTPLGVEVNGATRWINIGFQFQPSELAKFTIILTVASMIDHARKYGGINNLKNLGTIGVYVIFYGALIGIPQNHASVVMVIMLFVAMMLFFGGINKILFFGSGLLAAGAGLLIALSSEFRRQRIMTFLDPLSDKMGDGYQITQNWYALGSGELFGIGLGLGRQKFGWLPENNTDFILGVIGEEMGLIGVLFLITLYLFLIARGVHIATKSVDNYGLLLASGVISLISIQAIINMAVVSGLFPVTGMPLPFISYGGTTMIVMCMMVGVLYNVYSTTENEKLAKDKKEEKK
jgi:cell division protein FtsW